MGISRVGARLCATGAAVALTIGVLATAPANAAGDDDPTTTDPTSGITSSATYDCTMPGLSSIPILGDLLGGFDLSFSITIPDLSSIMPTGAELPDGTDVDATSSMPTGLFGGVGLGGFGGHFLTGGTEGGFGMLFGSLPFDLGSLVAPMQTVGDDGGDDLDATGELGDDFTLPSPGTYDFTLPDEFVLNPLSSVILPFAKITCSLKNPADAVTRVTVRKQTSNLIARLHRSTARVKVTRELGGRGTGRVVATQAGRTVGSGHLRHGVAKLHLEHLRAGDTVVVKYLGDSTTKAARTAI